VAEGGEGLRIDATHGAAGEVCGWEGNGSGFDPIFQDVMKGLSSLLVGSKARRSEGAGGGLADKYTKKCLSAVVPDVARGPTGIWNVIREQKPWIVANKSWKDAS
jgi:hypothetical protein